MYDVIPNNAKKKKQTINPRKKTFADRDTFPRSGRSQIYANEGDGLSTQGGNEATSEEFRTEETETRGKKERRKERGEEEVESREWEDTFPGPRRFREQPSEKGTKGRKAALVSQTVRKQLTPRIKWYRNETIVEQMPGHKTTASSFPPPIALSTPAEQAN